MRKPKLLKAMPCYLEKVQISLPPNIDKLEEELCQQLNEDRINRENKVADGTTISVIERRLQVCDIPVYILKESRTPQITYIIEKIM